MFIHGLHCSFNRAWCSFLKTHLGLLTINWRFCFCPLDLRIRNKYHHVIPWWKSTSRDYCLIQKALQTPRKVRGPFLIGWHDVNHSCIERSVWPRLAAQQPIEKGPQTFLDDCIYQPLTHSPLLAIQTTKQFVCHIYTYTLFIHSVTHWLLFTCQQTQRR